MDTNQPKQSSQQDLAHLQEAFDAFSAVSGNLQISYDGLQSQVDRLRAELQTANEQSATEAQRSRGLAKRLTALLEALPGGVVMLDDSGVVREINAAAHDFLGRPIKDLEWTLVCRRAFTTGSDEHGDLTLRDGRKITLAQKAIEPGPGQVLLLTDVTEDRKLHELLSRHRRLAAMGEMAAALAHQIRTPLSAGILYLSNVTDNDLNPAVSEKMLNKAAHCFRDLEQLINDMLHFARGAATGADRVELHELLLAVKASVAPLLTERQHVEINVPERDRYVKGNRESLAGALTNLVCNALQHAGNDARVTIDVHARAATIEISVRDNGPGVPEDYAEQVFDPFFTSRTNGTGLGLAVVRSVARAHGGDAQLIQDEKPGANFVLTVPEHQCDELQTNKDAAA